MRSRFFLPTQRSNLGGPFRYLARVRKAHENILDKWRFHQNLPTPFWAMSTSVTLTYNLLGVSCGHDFFLTQRFSLIASMFVKSTENFRGPWKGFQLKTQGFVRILLFFNFLAEFFRRPLENSLWTSVNMFEFAERSAWPRSLRQ